MMEETEQKLKKSRIALVFSIIGFLLGLVALFFSSLLTFGSRVFVQTLPVQLLDSFSLLYNLARAVSYGMEVLAFAFAVTALILAFAKKTRKVFPLVTIALILIAVGVTVAGKELPRVSTMRESVLTEAFQAMKSETMKSGQAEGDIYPKEFMDMIKHRSTIKAEPTPLMKAAEAGRTEEVRALLKEGASPNERSVMSLSACGLAVKNGNLDTFKVFLEDAAFESDKENLGDLLRVAIDQNQREFVVLLLAHGANINKRDLDADDWTPLMYAAYKGNEEIVKMLIERGAEIDMRNAGGGTALMFAATTGQERIAEKLLDSGADVNAKTVDGHTPLMSACDGGNLDIVKLLLSRGADINQRDTNGWSPMEWAARQGHIDLVRYLQQNGARK